MFIVLILPAHNFIVQLIVAYPIFIIVGILIAIFSKIIIEVAFGNDYIKYYYWVVPLQLWLVVAINNNFLGIQTLLGSGHDKEYSRCFQVGVISTILFNFILIYFFQGNGACVAPLMSELVLAIMLKKEIHKLKILKC